MRKHNKQLYRTQKETPAYKTPCPFTEVDPAITILYNEVVTEIIPRDDHGYGLYLYKGSYYWLPSHYLKTYNPRK